MESELHHQERIGLIDKFVEHEVAALLRRTLHEAKIETVKAEAADFKDSAHGCPTAVPDTVAPVDRHS